MSKIKAKIVVGLGYGDEGKGLTVNELCKTAKRPVVIRFSGGQQAGHTVHLGDVKHVCSNYGAGVLQDIPTYFTEHTTFYPTTIVREREVLLSKGVYDPILVIHPMAKMTTPWDVYENRNCEDNLDHGTCGLGVGKTMNRSIKENLTLTAVDLMHMPTLKAKIVSIKEYYGDTAELIADNSQAKIDFLQEVEDFWSAIDVMEGIIGIARYDYLTDFKTLIFEGSQGILLDKDHGVFPNVTYSNTTSKNAMKVCDKLNIKKRRVYCATRAYHTRHGSGIFHDTEGIALLETQHETNVNNEYQKEFKTAPLDYSLLDHAVAIESVYSEGYPQTLVVTCANQVPKRHQFDPMMLNSEWDDLKMSYSVYGDFTGDY